VLRAEGNHKAKKSYLRPTLRDGKKETTQTRGGKGSMSQENDEVGSGGKKAGERSIRRL